MTDRMFRMPIALSLRTLRSALWVLLMALLLVQTVGVLHRVAHAKQSAGVSTHQAACSSGLLSAIWGEHSNSADCQLFDQACPDLLELPVWTVLPAPALLIWREVLLLERFALFERLYAVRGPPVALN